VNEEIISINSGFITLTLILCVDTDAVALLVAKVVSFTLLMQYNLSMVKHAIEQPAFFCAVHFCVPDICTVQKSEVNN